MTETGNRSRKSPFHPGYLSSALVKQNLQLCKVALSFTFLDFSSQALAPNDPYTFHDDWDTNRCILRVFNQYISRLQDACHRSCCGARVRVAKVSKNYTVKFFWIFNCLCTEIAVADPWRDNCLESKVFIYYRDKAPCWRKKGEFRGKTANNGASAKKEANGAVAAVPLFQCLAWFASAPLFASFPHQETYFRGQVLFRAIHFSPFKFIGQSVVQSVGLS